jgi:hypothetical protein
MDTDACPKRENILQILAYSSVGSKLIAAMPLALSRHCADDDAQGALSADSSVAAIAPVCAG